MTTHLAMIPQFFDFVNNHLNYLNGPLNIKSQNNHKIVNYNKSQLTNETVKLYGLCRSIILNKHNEVVCFSPPKSIKYDIFVNDINNYEPKDKIIGMELIEGTMINVFWSSNSTRNSPDYFENGSWEISTKTTMGGKYGFYNHPNSKTFKTMFQEACTVNNLNINLLNKTLCYSFVLQHTENRIVISFDKHQLYLIAVYLIQNIYDSETNKHIDVVIYSLDILTQTHMFDNTTVKFPEIYYLNTFPKPSLIDTFASPDNSSPYTSLGIVYYNTMSGTRTKIRNPSYERIRQLRGNQSQLDYHYLWLRQTNQVSEFLKYYPETTLFITNCRNNIHLFTRELFTQYISCFIKKEKKLVLYSNKYKHHMYNLHQKYVNELKSKKLFITFTLVKEYVNKVPPALLMSSINYILK
jgi:hypothetical protein